METLLDFPVLFLTMCKVLSQLQIFYSFVFWPLNWTVSLKISVRKISEI